MILAAGLTPAWQQILVFDHVETGEVNRAREAHWYASGKVLNVGVATHFLGAESRLLSAGGGWPFSAMQMDLAALGISQRWVQTRSVSRVCTTILDQGNRTTTELVENTGAFTAAELAEFQDIYQVESESAEVVVLSGSLPQGTPATYYLDLVKKTSGRTILDIRGPELLHALSARPFLVKPNRAELAKTLGRDLTDDLALQAAMLDLNEQGARWVVITDGPHAVWVSSLGRTWNFIPPQVEVVNPIGCGDSLAAGIAVALDEGAEVIDAVQFGIAAAADNATQLLSCRLDRKRFRGMKS
ncbi:MAG: lacC [Planctomycetaceae bacterium]|nr:lacC [Planctomycetaceae bacterium]